MRLPASIRSKPHLAVKLGTHHEGVAFSSGHRRSVEDTASLLHLLKSRELARYERYAPHQLTKAAVQAAVMWNVVWTPAEGVVAPVIRGNPWALYNGATSDEWPTVLFAWDSCFAALMLSLDAKWLAYSTLIQIVRSKTKKGFVPNLAAGVSKSHHSQPPLASRVLLELYQRHGDLWVVELLFDDLLDWHHWFARSRSLSPLTNLTVLGGSSFDSARKESGLDNSPMYDGPTQGEQRATAAEFKAGRIQMYDVGMSSLVAMDARALAELASALGRSAYAMELSSRGEAVGKAIVKSLWDEDSSAYVNRLRGGGFVRRVSPTSFYPLLTRAPPDRHVLLLIRSWLTDARRFCIRPASAEGSNNEGKTKANMETSRSKATNTRCAAGLPSISADDPAFSRPIYWRGNVWGPMAMLVYWGLVEYDHLPEARAARRGLVVQMRLLMHSQWDRHGHICENYSPRVGATDCPSMKFYHWGALTGFISLLERERELNPSMILLKLSSPERVVL